MLWYSLEAPRRGASNEYPQHIFLLGIKKDIGIFRMKKVPYLLLCINLHICCMFKGHTILCYGLALLISIICLGRLHIACTYMYLFNLRQVRQGVDSLAQWLKHRIFYPEGPGLDHTIGGIFFFSCASFLFYDPHVVKWGLVRDFTSLKMVSRHQK